MTENEDHQTQTLRADRVVEKLHESDLVLHFERDGYDAFVRPIRVGEYELRHRHYHEDDWREGTLDETGLKAEIERLSSELVDREESPFNEAKV